MHDSTRVDEGRNSSTLPAIKMKVRTGIGGGGECLLYDPRSELRKGGSWRSRANTIDGMEKEKEKKRGILGAIYPDWRGS